ncbi:Pyridine nucleotide-disulfide oxidoreductase [Sulfitobacter noctilucicola]|uniref:Sulfide:quinone oxidoreductase n=1 Tax=Sulfitobacter noctilucicola TaxID=1342301 RepID=A0A7W6Q1Z8_9RHOB|nr:TIGR01244 family sulfur transferase [Sulfitobacter noctilucicola]KIN62889.1 Pyridine nucleotide-disulfide oxidoreductase [Sulfitobacter noctilucicola]MBB4172580.1 sulfide:quinone oxidoreductase [Sulfitobacter noctilucicola]
MELKKISEKFTVSPQISPADMAEIKAAGFRAIICNRPNGEDAGQPPFEEIETAAKAVGIEARYIPVQSSGLTKENVTALKDAMEELEHPVLAYCRSGTRSATLWSIHETAQRTTHEN